MYESLSVALKLQSIVVAFFCFLYLILVRVSPMQKEKSCPSTIFYGRHSYLTFPMYALNPGFNTNIAEKEDTSMCKLSNINEAHVHSLVLWQEEYMQNMFFQLYCFSLSHIDN